jgi:IclR family acetate operon transcriptional repressor
MLEIDMPNDMKAKRTRGRPRTVSNDGAAGRAKGGAKGGAQALRRGLTLLNALAEVDTATLTELSLRSGLPASTAHRLLTTLENHGFTEFDETTNLWMVGVEAFRAGNSFQRRLSLVDAARNAMRDLVERTGETANLAVPDGAEVVFVAQVECANPVRAFFKAGTRTPMHASGIGKALLAAIGREGAERRLRDAGMPRFTPKTLAAPDALFKDLDAARTRGWAFDDEERHLGMRCVAATIHDALGEPIAGVSVSGPSQRFSSDAVGEFGPLVKRAAARITERMGGVAPEA